MNRNDPFYQACVRVLREELVPATGCTEPIALAYAAALARDTLGALPEEMTVCCSGSIIKNVKSAVVPNTGGLKGIEAAAAAGAAAGHAERKLEVLSEVGEGEIAFLREYLKSVRIALKPLNGEKVFEILLTARSGEHTATVRIADTHTRVVLLEKDGQTLLSRPDSEESREAEDRTFLNIAGIYDFACSLDPMDVRKVLTRQIDFNMAIAEEGLRGSWGANIGRTLLRVSGGDRAPVELRARAMAAAGSDARMSGCELPVVINSGSGNQGITVSVPVIVYARDMNAGEEKLLRALALANLCAIQQKAYLGTLSAFCGAVSAGVGAGAGIAFLQGGDERAVAHTVANALAIIAGMICDGAKPSCAAKISQAVEAGIFGWQMYQCGQQFLAGDGIVVKGADANVRAVGRLGREGMRGTNEEIIRMMTGADENA